MDPVRLPPQVRLLCNAALTLVDYGTAIYGSVDEHISSWVLLYQAWPDLAWYILCLAYCPGQGRIPLYMLNSVKRNLLKNCFLLSPMTEWRESYSVNAFIGYLNYFLPIVVKHCIGKSYQGRAFTLVGGSGCLKKVSGVYISGAYRCLKCNSGPVHSSVWQNDTLKALWACLWLSAFIAMERRHGRADNTVNN